VVALWHVIGWDIPFMSKYLGLCGNETCVDTDKTHANVRKNEPKNGTTQRAVLSLSQMHLLSIIQRPQRPSHFLNPNPNAVTIPHITFLFLLFRAIQFFFYLNEFLCKNIRSESNIKMWFFFFQNSTRLPFLYSNKVLCQIII